MKSIPLFKSHFSLGKSILTLDKPSGDINKNPASIIDLALDSGTGQLCLVDENMTGFLDAVKHCQDKKLKLLFGVRLNVTHDITQQDEASLKKRARYIVFAKNNAGYQALIKMWSIAACKGFYYKPCIDFAHLKDIWTKDLLLAVPFYDSFLHVNSLGGHAHVPNWGDMNPVFMLENHDLPFDPILRAKVLAFTKEQKLESVETHSIFYRSPQDFIAYMTFRCISERTTIEKPELDHCGSDNFSYISWKEQQA